MELNLQRVRLHKSYPSLRRHPYVSDMNKSSAKHLCHRPVIRYRLVHECVVLSTPQSKSWLVKNSHGHS